MSVVKNGFSIVKYLDGERLNKVSAQAFQAQKPYPWVSIEGILTPEGYQRLRETLPNESIFERQVGIKRSHGQASHDRYLLHFRPGLMVSAPWQEFIAELHGDTYQSFLRRMLGPRQFILTLEWYYAWLGCAVSPHCDAARKLATQIFYFNDESDWDPAWGGQILILDSRRQFKTHSGPSFDDLQVAAALDARGNGSLLFQRTPHSWHGVRPLRCPLGKLRKLFLVTVNVPNAQVRWRRLRGKDPDGYRIRT